MMRQFIIFITLFCGMKLQRVGSSGDGPSSNLVKQPPGRSKVSAAVISRLSDSDGNISGMPGGTQRVTYSVHLMPHEAFSGVRY